MQEENKHYSAQANMDWITVNRHQWSMNRVLQLQIDSN